MKLLRITGRSKYGNIKMEVDGLSFASKKEGRRYMALRILAAQGKITGLICQPRYVLQEKFKRDRQNVREIAYVGDFQYEEYGRTVVEDVKGIKTPVFKLKQKMFWKIYPEIELRIL